MGRERSITWVLFGCGCGCFLVFLAIVAAVGGISWVAVQSAQDLERDLEDPDARDEGARAVLRTDQLPDGYHAEIFLEIPFVLELAALTDGPVSQGAPKHLESDRMVLVVRIRDPFASQRESLRRFVEGEDARLDLDLEIDFDAETGEELGRGSLSLENDHEAPWIAHEARYEGREGRTDGIQMIAFGDCGDDKWLDLVVWLRPMSASTSTRGSRDLERDLQGLAESVSFCPDR